jgi:hypothetical protein
MEKNCGKNGNSSLPLVNLGAATAAGGNVAGFWDWK